MAQATATTTEMARQADDVPIVNRWSAVLTVGAHDHEHSGMSSLFAVAGTGRIGFGAPGEPTGDFPDGATELRAHEVSPS